MIENDTVPFWAVSLAAIGVVVPLVAVIAVCICGCRKTVPKNELQGLAGMVKITNPEEVLNHNHLSNENANRATVGTGAACVEITDVNRRTSATVNRSLPAIPSDNERSQPGGDTIWENEPNGDTSSELYATVGDKQVSQPLGVGLQAGNRAPKRLSTLESQPDESKSSEHSSLSQIDDGCNHYDCLKQEHPYDKLKKSEHPYAQVRPCSDIASNNISQNPGPSRNNISSSEASGNPVPPPRTRKSASQSSLVITSSPRESLTDIPAATAIAGQVSANQDLPYMTPPITTSSNFSGDSQDSKGYTSISVREPLANIKAQTKSSSQRNRALELVDSHYATVSDDSDEMYAAIEEPGQLYTSGSETYAQIQPTNISEQATSGDPIVGADSSLYPPQPPSVDSLKHVAQAHSRQASSSSATSSVANLGSPKPEKRQANSPLPPPPPSGSPDVFLSGDKRNFLAPSDTMNVEEMYAKVMKKKRNPETADASESNSRASLTGHSSKTGGDSLNHLSSSRECLKMEGDTEGASGSVSELVADSRDSKSFSGELVHPDLEVTGVGHGSCLLSSGGNYESVGISRASDPRYVDPGYEVVESRNIADGNASNRVSQEQIFEEKSSSHTSGSNLFNNNSTYSLSSNDNNNNESRTDSDCYPRYESVHSMGFPRDDPRDTTTFSDDASEPNYESMPSEETEHSYAGVQGASGSSEVDPNYEMVEHDDPNYESVNYFQANNDPPYERLHNEEIRDSDTDTIPGYEQVNHRNAFDYQKLDSTRNNESELHISEPGYEEVGRRKESPSSDVWKRETSNAGCEMPSASSMESSGTNNKAG